MRRQFAIAVGVCAAAGGLVLLAASRTWDEVMTHQIAPLPPYTDEVSGTELYAWLPAVGFVALAGAGALVATRGLLRRTVGVLLAAAGFLAAWAGVHESGLWPLVCVAAGVALAAVGALTVYRGRSWPLLGTRYERPTNVAREGTEDYWEAIDRGEDPTR